MLKNNVHNLLHHTGRVLDFVYKRFDHYVDDSIEVNCNSCKEIWEKIREDYVRHIEMLRDEIVRHAKEDGLE